MERRKPLIDYQEEGRQEALDRWLELDLERRRQEEAARQYSLPAAFGSAFGDDRFVAWVSENTVGDPAVEEAWLAGCPRDRRHYTFAVPDHSARVWPIDLQTGNPGPEESPGKLFAKRLGPGVIVVQGFVIRFVECGTLRGPRIPKKMVGAAIFRRVSIDFSWSLQEELHLREIVGHDETPVRRVMKKLKFAPWDSRFDPRGIDKDILARWP